MQDFELKKEIEYIWNSEKNLTDSDCAKILSVIEFLNSGQLRVAYKKDNSWTVDEYIKKAILLCFKIYKLNVMPSECCNFHDKIPLKTLNWTKEDFGNAGFRAVPGAIVRYGAFVAKNVVLMPSFVNIGAFIDENSMIDSNALVGSCAQIGKRCHISDSVTIGGVLEPIQANPVIIEDDCFIGAKSVVTEGVIVEEGSVIGAGTVITASTKIISRDDNSVIYGRVPAHSVVVAGSYKCSETLNVNCAIIIKQTTPEIRKKTSINELLRG